MTSCRWRSSQPVKPARTTRMNTRSITGRVYTVKPAFGPLTPVGRLVGHYGWPYLSGEKSVGVTNVDSTLPTSGPPASEVSRIDFHAGSLRKSSHDFFAASRLSCDTSPRTRVREPSSQTGTLRDTPAAPDAGPRCTSRHGRCCAPVRAQAGLAHSRCTACRPRNGRCRRSARADCSGLSTTLLKSPIQNRTSPGSDRS